MSDQCDGFKQAELRPYNFKCLIVVQKFGVNKRRWNQEEGFK